MRRASGTADDRPKRRFSDFRPRVGRLRHRRGAITLVPSRRTARWRPSTPQRFILPPSTTDRRLVCPRPMIAAAPIRIELSPRSRRAPVRFCGESLRAQTEGMRVRLYHQFGNVGGESDVAVVDANATFEIPRVPPGWYRLSIAPRGPESPDPKSEFAERLIEVKDHDVEGLALVLGPGASITGRVAVEGAASVTSGVGLRVSAAPTPEQYSASGRSRRRSRLTGPFT